MNLSSSFFCVLPIDRSVTLCYFRYRLHLYWPTSIYLRGYGWSKNINQRPTRSFNSTRGSWSPQGQSFNDQALGQKGQITSYSNQLPRWPPLQKRSRLMASWYSGKRRLPLTLHYFHTKTNYSQPIFCKEKPLTKFWWGVVVVSNFSVFRRNC